MNGFAAYQQKTYAAAACGEMRGPTFSLNDSVVCPKPRRLGFFNTSINDHIRPSRCHMNCHQTEICDSRARTELLDIILTEGSYSAEKPNNFHVASSPPFFCGSPPSRASNPVIQDRHFGSNEISPLAPPPIITASPNLASRKGGACVPMKFGQKPAAVRIEGFDCLGRDRQHRSISAVA
ncbi:uncharacterized protein LOC132307802 [Cornus florida]|uniref:uncharacterized protein LOC132307802 n=1 Tax=Cornus florida TaxID=4283 RepID=UPI00289A2717|nr:uncharacterized protein LOC132307802 [Cornus florida]